MIDIQAMFSRACAENPEEFASVLRVSTENRVPVRHRVPAVPASSALASSTPASATGTVSVQNRVSATPASTASSVPVQNPVLNAPASATGTVSMQNRVSATPTSTASSVPVNSPVPPVPAPQQPVHNEKEESHKARKCVDMVLNILLVVCVLVCVYYNISLMRHMDEQQIIWLDEEDL